MAKLSIRDLEVQDREVLMRVDFNVPLHEGEITDDTRIRAALPSIEHLLGKGARLVLCSHLGRPKGEPDPQFSLRPAATRLGELLGKPVGFAPDCVGEEVSALRAGLGAGEVLLLENTRFHAGEKGNDPGFAEALAGQATVFVNDAFGTAHRAHGSTEGVTHHVEQSAMGFLIERELEYLCGKLENPERPFLVILGGAKVSDKIEVITALLEKADSFLIGGAMANTFRKAQGHEMGKSLLEEDKLDLALEILKKAEEKGVKFLLPADTRVTMEFKEGAETKVTAPYADGGSVGPEWEGIDIGDVAIEEFCAEVGNARTIVWNGPMGVFEIDSFAKGTEALARAVAASDAVSIVGGGDSVTAIKKYGLESEVHLHLDRGRSLPRTPGRKSPAGSGSAQHNLNPPRPMSRKLIIAANWKMNKGPAATAEFLEAFLPGTDEMAAGCDMVVAPPAVSLAAAAGLLAGTSVSLSAQNVSQFDDGAFTGEVSTGMLAEIGAEYVIIGHSERRSIYGETDDVINAKIRKALAAGLKPIFCIGETLDEREAGKLEDVLRTQVRDGLADLNEADLANCVVAYEPVWAIGTGVTATPEQAQEAHAFVRSLIAELFSAGAAAGVRIQYGGSVKPGNSAELMSQPDIDGALVGGASLEAQSFRELIENGAAAVA